MHTKEPLQNKYVIYYKEMFDLNTYFIQLKSCKNGSGILS